MVELKRRNDADMREALAKFRAAADERVPAMQDAVSRSSEVWLRTNGVSDALPPDGIYYLSTADQISVAPGFQFLSQNIGPWANWVRGPAAEEGPIERRLFRRADHLQLLMGEPDGAGQDGQRDRPARRHRQLRRDG